MIRLDKYLCDSGRYTRSQAKELIKKKRVTVDDNVITKPETKIGDAKVCVDGEEISFSQFEYYMLNKPAGYVSATYDNDAPTVVSLIKSCKKDLFPVGRLDKDTEGLLLITNDGELAHNLLSPKKHVDKKYFVKVSGTLNDDMVERFRLGIRINDEFTTKPALLEIVSENSCYVTIHEGKFHQIKRMFIAVGTEVVYLKRISMKNLILDDRLKLGEYRELSAEELQDLKDR